MTMMASSALSSVGRRLLVVRKVATHRYQKVATVVALPNRPGQGLAFHRERLSNNNAGVVALAAANATSTTSRRSASSASASASSASAARSRDTPPSKTLPSPPTEENDEGAVDPAVYDHLQFTLSPPDQLTVEMARGIAESTQFFLLHGLPYRRLQLLAQDKHMPVVTKWQKMLETFLSTQIHVLAGMGYGASEQGLSQYVLATTVLYRTVPYLPLVVPAADHPPEPTNMKPIIIHRDRLTSSSCSLSLSHTLTNTHTHLLSGMPRICQNVCPMSTTTKMLVPHCTSCDVTHGGHW